MIIATITSKLVLMLHRGHSDGSRCSDCSEGQDPGQLQRDVILEFDVIVGEAYAYPSLDPRP